MADQGLVLIYTGNGKGKTTAALGLSLRQVGQGGRVLFLQFLKGSANGGEHLAASHLPSLEIIPCGKEGFIIGEPSAEDRKLAQEGLARAKAAVTAGTHSMVVLDEANVAVQLGLLTTSDLKDLIQQRGQTHLVLTGRGAGAEIVAMGDIVSELVEVKHDYATGRQALPGIEY